MMNIDARRTDTEQNAAAIRLAGEDALCDPGGALFFPGLRLLAVSDLHLEKGAAFARRGAMLPPYDTAATLARLAASIERYRPDIVVSLGDSFHDRRGAPELPDPYRAALSQMASACDWYWIAGNHDPDAPAGLPGHSVQELAIGNLVFRHEPSARTQEGEVAGHLHPGARLVRRGRSVRRRCFATDGLRVVMPAFGAFTGSLNVLDHAFAGLFGGDGLMAYMLGPDRVYPIAGRMLSAG